MKIVLPILLSVFTFFISIDAISAQSATSSSTASATTTSTSTTATASTTKGGTVDMPETLPQTGAFETTVALIVLGLLTIGVGMYTQYALPLVLEEE